MSDYISREDALKGRKTGTFVNGVRFVAEPCVTVKYIKSLKPANVVPVVFCKDCRKRRKDGYCTKFIQNTGELASAWYMPQDDDFCSYGKRR